MKTSAIALFLVLSCALVGVLSQSTQRGFVVQIENLSGGSLLPTAFSPAVWAVFSSQTNPLFQTGSYASAGLQSFAEDANPANLLSEVLNKTGVLSAGVATGGVQPVAGFVGLNGIPIGGQVSFGVRAKPGDKFSFVAQFWESNNDFYGTEPIPLFDKNGNTVSGSFEVNLYYGGTEAEETPGAGSFQPPRQRFAGDGTKTSFPVSLKDVGYYVPATSTVIRLTITPASSFSVKLENIGNATLSAPFWAVSTQPNALFTLGQAPSSAFAALATSGASSQLISSLSSSTGVLFAGQGSTSNIPPSSFAQWTVTATPGSMLFLATKVVGQTATFVSTYPGGLDLFGNNGALFSSSVSSLGTYSSGNQVKDASATYPASSFLKLSITPTFTEGTQTTVSDAKFTPAAPNQDVKVSFVFTDLIQP